MNTPVYCLYDMGKQNVAYTEHWSISLKEMKF